VYAHKQVKLRFGFDFTHQSESLSSLEGGSIAERACIDDRNGSEESRRVACIYPDGIEALYKGWVWDAIVLDDRYK
jgi:hypothetical protein